MRKNLILFLLFISMNFSAFAETQHKTRFLKQFDKWRVFEKTQEIGKECFIVSEPHHSTGFPGFRDIPHAIFSTVKGGAFTFSVYSGFVINKQEPIQVFVGSKRFYLKLYRDFFAYTYDSRDDVSLINSVLQDRDTIRIRTVSREKEVANDYYAFKGLDKAFEFVNKNPNCK
jgi:hypothetical protein